MGKFHPHGDSASLRHPGAHGPGVLAALSARGRAGELRLDRRRPAGGHALHRGADGPDRPRDAGRHRQGHRRLRAQLRRQRSRSRSSCRREFPNLLVNGSAGIAVGMATNIPPHNLTEVVDGLVALHRQPDTTVERADEDHHRAPISRRAGYIYGSGGIREAYTTGRGTITLRAKAHAEKLRGGREAIIITELPYQVNKASADREDLRAERARRRSRASRRSATSRTAKASGSCMELGRGRDPADPAQPALQAHPDADDVRHHHAGAGRPAAAGRQPQGDARGVHQVPARGRHPPYALRPGAGRGARPHPRRAPQGGRAARPRHPHHPGGRQRRRRPRRR